MVSTIESKLTCLMSLVQVPYYFIYVFEFHLYGLNYQSKSLADSAIVIKIISICMATCIMPLFELFFNFPFCHLPCFAKEVEFQRSWTLKSEGNWWREISSGVMPRLHGVVGLQGKVLLGELHCENGFTHKCTQLHHVCICMYKLLQ